MALTKLNNNSLHAITDASALKNVTGTVLQVQQVELTQRHHINTTSRTGLSGGVTSLSITPKFASSKILVQTNMDCIAYNPGTIRAVLVRNPPGANTDVSQLGWYAQGSHWQAFNTNFCYLDSPATTSALSYYVEWRLDQNEIYVNYANTGVGFGSVNDSRSTITAMEIAG